MGLPVVLACAAKGPNVAEVAIPPAPPPPDGGASTTSSTPLRHGERWLARYDEFVGPECEEMSGEAHCAYRDDITGAANCPASFGEQERSLPLARTPSDQESASRHRIVCCYAEPLLCTPVRHYRGRVLDGRPAESMERTDWQNAAAPDHDAIDWCAMAAAEHAAIASFARTTLELLALGAPPALLEETQRAALDEIGHARFAYAMASQRAGRALGPGPLAAAAQPFGAPSLAAFASATFRDACVAETLGAIAVRRDAERAPPALRARLVAIAEDEERHAELAWRTLAWAVREGGAAARDALRIDVERLARAESGAGPMNDVVLPCARALLDG